LTVTGSTISGNTTDTTFLRDVTTSGFGGGVDNEGRLTISNSTISGNKALPANCGGGGGIGVFNNGDLSVSYRTISDREMATGTPVGLCPFTPAPTLGGGLFNNNNNNSPGRGTASLLGAIVAHNLAPGGGNDCFGSVSSLGAILLQDPSGCTLTGSATSNRLGIDAKLGPLQDNGGPTFTRCLLSGSPAIDAAVGVSCPATDQRGVPRPRDGDADGSAVCDIGAFER
jgi:hypothetical protein